MDMCNSILLKLSLKLIVIYSSLLHLSIRQQVQYCIITLIFDNWSISTILWIWSNSHISIWQLWTVKCLQKVSITSFNGTVDYKHLLSVPLLIVLRILAVVVGWVDKANCSWKLSFCHNISNVVSSVSDVVFVIKAKMVINYTLFLLFKCNCRFKWHHSFAVLA